jgi:hypothetical protein
MLHYPRTVITHPELNRSEPQHGVRSFSIAAQFFDNHWNCDQIDLSVQTRSENIDLGHFTGFNFPQYSNATDQIF